MAARPAIHRLRASGECVARESFLITQSQPNSGSSFVAADQVISYSCIPPLTEPPAQRAIDMARLAQLKLTLAFLALVQLGWLVYVISRTSTKPEPPPAVAAARTPAKRAAQVAAAGAPPLPPPSPPPPLPGAVEPPPSALEQRVLDVCGTAWQAAYSSAHAA